MTYRLIYHPEVRDDLRHIPRNIKESLRKAIENRLAFDPLLYGRPLRQSLKGHRKLRVGEYRIIYRVSGDDVIILKIGHRREVYEQVLDRVNREAEKR